ncbi:hypothetical protein L3N51_01272 [Metallosphaera sp. J1]|uniref:hypothetical protein n=1 Tax=Metallosphaera javensis (ex Hofmann et al. 2022) TaxID=99938 RepID=UPI001EDDD7F2|nr:hypothetical protein [Metallosphaera javensis (ex Hofmann et al. 2022)]MCG3108982.1 hypothetical protein [Metallosphaera javensis (ex Hofmann et al. 2022)]
MLRPKDIVAWIFTMVLMALVFLWIGDFGTLGYLAQSPISAYVENLWRLMYISASGVFGVFMGSLIFFSIRFRYSETVQEQQVRRADISKMVLPVILVSGIGLAYAISQYFSNVLEYQFNLGLLVGLMILLFSSLIFVIYKEYFRD